MNISRRVISIMDDFLVLSTLLLGYITGFLYMGKYFLILVITTSPLALIVILLIFDDIKDNLKKKSKE